MAQPTVRAFFVCLFLLPLLTYSQKRKGYLSIAPAVDLIKQTDPAYGGYVSGNAMLGRDVYLGLELGAMKFPGLKPVYIPTLLKFTYMPSNRSSISPMIVLAPGYGFYSQKRSAASVLGTTNGGFCLYSGVGLASRPVSGLRGFMTVGYARYGFTTRNVESAREGVGLRFGLIVQ